MRGAEALAVLKNRESGELPSGLFGKIETQLEESPQASYTGQHFWLGTAFGGAVAASLFAAALTFGWVGLPATDTSEVAEFVVAVREPRNMEIAIETDRPLYGASISIILTGGVELDGYGSQRELNWTADLDAGINRLSLPVVASKSSGGQIVVRMSHPESERVFVVQLKTNA
jgi:hypothetical protein